MADRKLSGKIVFFSDIDETLVNTDKTLSEENRAAIEQFLARDNIFVISTGRALEGARTLLEKLGLYGRKNLLISSYNGALIYDTYLEKELRRTTIPLDLVAESFDLAKEFGIHIQTYTDEAVISERDNEFLQHYLKIQSLPVILCEDIRKAQIAPPPKCLCLDFTHPERILQFRSLFEEKMKGKLDCYQSNPWLLEIVAPGVNKGESLRYIAQLYNVPIENTLSAGDAENDLSMIQAAGIGCAMKNAEEPLKEQADYVTLNDNNHGGIAEILNRFCL